MDAPPAEAASDSANSDLVQRIGHLTRSLHDSLRELGYHHRMEQMDDLPASQGF